MKLNNPERENLRKAMLASFTFDDLDIFVQDHLNVELATVLNIASGFGIVCQRFILWAERNGELTRFLQFVAADPQLPKLLQIATELVQKAQARAAPGVGSAKPFIVRSRPLIDRDPLWKLITALDDPGTNRVLVVNGGVGKSHSTWMLSYLCDPSFGTARFVLVDALDAEVPVTPGSLAKLLSMGVWETANGAGSDPFALDSRDAKGLARRLISRLSALEKPTWLVIDELDLVNLEPESLELLARLSKAIDQGQCPNLWLFLIGLDPKGLGTQVGPYVPVDLVTRPKRNDIESYVTWFAQSVSSNEPPAKLAAAVDELDAVLQPAPSYEDWEAFHNLLRDKCTRLKEATPL